MGERLNSENVHKDSKIFGNRAKSETGGNTSSFRLLVVLLAQGSQHFYF